MVGVTVCVGGWAAGHQRRGKEINISMVRTGREKEGRQEKEKGRGDGREGGDTWEGKKKGTCRHMGRELSAC